MPKVTVIIPSYNHAQFLEQRIESVLNQTFQDFEIIFLDDASTDNSKEVFAKYANHPKISHIIFNETNSGSPFKQWKKGFSLATGEYIWIAESDDDSDVIFLEKLIPLMGDNVALAYCRSATTNENNEIFNHFWSDDLDNQRWKKAYSADGLTEISNFLVFRNTIPNASSVLFRKEWANFDLPITEMKYAGDWLFWINILKEENRQIVYIPEQLNYFRSHSNNTRSVKGPIQESQRLKEYFIVIDRALKISDYNFFDIIAKRRNWFWIFDLFNSMKPILPLEFILFPPFSPIFILLLQWQQAKNKVKSLAYKIKTKILG